MGSYSISWYPGRRVAIAVFQSNEFKAAHDSPILLVRMTTTLK